MAMRWYVVHAYSGFEGQVKKVLSSRVDASPYQGFIRPDSGSH